MEILGFDIQQAFTPDVSIFETIFRGVLVYLVILVLVRYGMRGQTTSSMSSLLVIVLIADAAQNAMASDYNSITNGIVLVATIISTAMILNYLGGHFAFVQDLINQQRRPLVIDGRIIRKTLNSELMTEEELMAQLRLQGIDNLGDVKASYLEGTGSVSVIKKKPDDDARKSAPETGAAG